MANILILGAGRVGSTVAEQLVLEQHNVTIVDANPQNLRPQPLYDLTAPDRLGDDPLLAAQIQVFPRQPICL